MQIGCSAPTSGPLIAPDSLVRIATEAEMLGETVERFFTPEDVAVGRVATEMRNALATGRGNDERWHQRKGGARVWAVGEMTVLLDEGGAAVEAARPG